MFLLVSGPDNSNPTILIRQEGNKLILEWGGVFSNPSIFRLESNSSVEDIGWQDVPANLQILPQGQLRISLDLPENNSFYRLVTLP